MRRLLSPHRISVRRSHTSRVAPTPIHTLQRECSTIRPSILSPSLPRATSGNTTTTTSFSSPPTTPVAVPFHQIAQFAYPDLLRSLMTSTTTLSPQVSQQHVPPSSFVASPRRSTARVRHCELNDRFQNRAERLAKAAAASAPSGMAFEETASRVAECVNRMFVPMTNATIKPKDPEIVIVLMFVSVSNHAIPMRRFASEVTDAVVDQLPAALSASSTSCDQRMDVNPNCFRVVPVALGFDMSSRRRSASPLSEPCSSASNKHVPLIFLDKSVSLSKAGPYTVSLFCDLLVQRQTRRQLTYHHCPSSKVVVVCCSDGYSLPRTITDMYHHTTFLTSRPKQLSNPFSVQRKRTKRTQQLTTRPLCPHNQTVTGVEESAVVVGVEENLKRRGSPLQEEECILFQHVPAIVHGEYTSLMREAVATTVVAAAVTASNGKASR